MELEFLGIPADDRKRKRGEGKWGNGEMEERSGGVMAWWGDGAMFLPPKTKHGRLVTGFEVQ